MIPCRRRRRLLDSLKPPWADSPPLQRRLLSVATSSEFRAVLVSPSTVEPDCSGANRVVPLTFSAGELKKVSGKRPLDLIDVDFGVLCFLLIDITAFKD